MLTAGWCLHEPRSNAVTRRTSNIPRCCVTRSRWRLNTFSISDHIYIFFSSPSHLFTSSVIGPSGLFKLAALWSGISLDEGSTPPFWDSCDNFKIWFLTPSPMISKRMVNFDHWTKYLRSVRDLAVQVAFSCHMRGRIWVWMMVMMISCNPIDSSFEVECAKTVFSKYLDVKTLCAKLFVNQFISVLSTVPSENYHLRLIARFQQRVGDICLTFKF